MQELLEALARRGQTGPRSELEAMRSLPEPTQGQALDASTRLGTAPLFPVSALAEALRYWRPDMKPQDFVGTQEWAQEKLGGDPESKVSTLADFAMVDATDLARLADAPGMENLISAMVALWHGGPNKWDTPAVGKARGTGGARLGPGMYLSDREPVADYYADFLSGRVNPYDTRVSGMSLDEFRETLDPYELDIFEGAWNDFAEAVQRGVSDFESGDDMSEAFIDYIQDPEQGLIYLIEDGVIKDWSPESAQGLANKISSMDLPVEDGSYLYRAELPDEVAAEFLDLDAPLSEQPRIQELLAPYQKGDPNRQGHPFEGELEDWLSDEAFTGQDLVDHMADEFNTSDGPSKWLEGAGIRGLIAKDDHGYVHTRPEMRGAKEYVSFKPDEDLDVRSRKEREEGVTTEWLGAKPENPPTPDMNPRSREYGERAGLYHDVGGGLKLDNPLHELTRTIENRMILQPEVPRTIEDLQGRSLIGLSGDRSDTGSLVTHIGDQELLNEIQTQGGRGYMRLGPEEQAWASGGTVPQKLANRAQSVIDETGQSPIGVFNTMSHNAANFNHMVTDAALDLIKQAEIPRESVDFFDGAFRQMYPDFVGLDSPKLAAQLRQRGDMRRAFNDTLSLGQFKKMGFPDMTVIRAALADPKLMDVPNATAGQGMAELTGKLIDSPSLVHGTYDKVLGGKYFGDMEGVPRNVLFRDWWAGRPQGPRTTEAHHAKSFERQAPIQYVDQQLVDTIMKLQEAGR